MAKDQWANDSVQFVRLLAEINACGLHEDQVAAIADSMEVDEGDIHLLLDRAERQWTKIKDEIIRG